MSETSEERVRPFVLGTQALDWVARNCWECAKVDACPWQAEVYQAVVTGGTIRRETARAIGVPIDTLSDWRCREFDPLP